MSDISEGELVDGTEELNATIHSEQLTEEQV